MNTIRALCSHCGHEMQLPATFVGKQGKCPACGQSTEIIASTASVEMHSPVQPPPAQQVNVRTQAKETAKLAGAKAKAVGGMIYEQAKKGARSSKESKFGSLFGAKSPQAVGNSRYPNLTKYLQVMEMLTRVIFMISLVIIAVGGAVGIGLGLYGIGASLLGGGGGTRVFMNGLTLLVGTPIAGLIYYFLLIVYRIIALASLELIRVFMDTEENTRTHQGLSNN